MKFSKPQIVGYMSVDGGREYHSDLSQLKFLTFIPEGRTHYNLNHNIQNAVKRTTDGSNENISLLLKCILNQKQHISQYLNQDLQFITYRRSLISVMCSAFINEPVCIVASLYKNVIYLCSMETAEEKSRRLSRTEQEKRCCAWGYKFEQYLLSDKPKLLPNITTPVVENEEFSINYYSSFGEHKLLYCAQIDGLLATDENVPDPPVTNDFQQNLNYLRHNVYVELKTNREIRSPRHKEYFKNKLLRCWCQCFLAHLEGLLMGYRTDDGIIKKFDWFDTKDIVNFCKDAWNTETALKCLDSFLTLVKESLKKEADKGCKPEGNEIISLQFDIENKTTKVSTYQGEPILPSWYVENI